MVPLEQLFIGANVFVLPFWAIMIILPNWQWTKRIMSSFLPHIALAILYIILFVFSLDSKAAQALANPTLHDITQAFSQESIAAAGWVHFLVMDLFVGRWIYWEGQRTGTWTIHSLLLCLFAGPIGLLSHIFTATIMDRLESHNHDRNASEAV